MLELPAAPDERKGTELGGFAKGGDEVLGHGAGDDKGVQEIGKPPRGSISKRLKKPFGLELY